MTTTTPKVSTSELPVILAVLGACLILYGVLTIYAQHSGEYELLLRYWPPATSLLTLGGVALLGALVVHVMGRSHY